MIRTEDRRAIRDLAREFARERLRPSYQAGERLGVLDRALVREMGNLGFLGANLPEEYGGLAESGVMAGVIAEELAYGDFNVSSLPVNVSLLGAIIMGSGDNDLARQ